MNFRHRARLIMHVDVVWVILKRKL